MTCDDRITVLYDGACPLCSREVNLWRRRKHADRLKLIDIAADDFDPTVYGLTHRQVRERMHAILPDGRIVTAMEAFRRIYAALGMGWLLAPTRWPVIRPIADWFYRIFATHIRPRLSRCECRDGHKCRSV